MPRNAVSFLLAGALLATGSCAFVPSPNKTPLHRSELGVSTVDDVVKLKGIDEDLPSKPPRKDIVMSEAIPFLKRPAVLTGELAGDVGFDPLSLAKNKEQLWAYREAEVKHGRLAMLAAAGWPLSELWDRSIADYFGLASALDDGDRVPSLLNGGMLDKVVPEFWGCCLGMCAAIDSYGVQRARAGITGYRPGDLGWDPLNLYPNDKEGKGRMQLAEIKHGRAAMLGVTGFAAQEYTSKVGVVDETPFFFYPVTETAEDILAAVTL